MPAKSPQNSLTWIKRFTILLLLLAPHTLSAQTKSVQAKPVKLTPAEIKDAERIFATFKKRLEKTNDLRIALHGMPGDDWFRRVVNSNFANVDEMLPVDKKFFADNSHKQLPGFQQFYLSLMRFNWSFWLYTNFFEDTKDKGDSEINALFSKLLPSAKKLYDEMSGGDLHLTNMSQVIRTTNHFDSVTNLANKKLKQFRLKQPVLYGKVLLRSNFYTDDKAVVITCDDLCLSLPKGSEILVRDIGIYHLYVGKKQNRIVLLGIFFLSI